MFTYDWVFSVYSIHIKSHFKQTLACHESCIIYVVICMTTRLHSSHEYYRVTHFITHLYSWKTMIIRMMCAPYLPSIRCRCQSNIQIIKYNILMLSSSYIYPLYIRKITNQNMINTNLFTTFLSPVLRDVQWL